MKVYVVDDAYYEVQGVFTHQEDADEWVMWQVYPADYDVHEFELNALLPAPPLKKEPT